MQMLVVSYEGTELSPEVAAELKRLREHDIVRLVDVLVVSKADDGTITAVEGTDLTPDESTELGAIAGALIGLGAAGEEGAEIGALAGAEAAADGGSLLEGEVWYVADAIPPGSRAAVAILEHRWAIGLRDALLAAGAHGLVDAWIHPSDLVGLGAEMALEAEAEAESEAGTGSPA
jgi:uncharacterized membrane protein